MTHTYVFAFDPEPEGGYTVTCPALPGLVSYGETLQEAREMARDATEGLIEVMLEKGEAVPESDPPSATQRYEQFVHTLREDNESRTLLERLTIGTTEMV